MPREHMHTQCIAFILRGRRFSKSTKQQRKHIGLYVRVFAVSGAALLLKQGQSVSFSVLYLPTALQLTSHTLVAVPMP